ncbi:hypothetical protein [Ancylobacter vacuolatus]|uniref:Uncharacterized protein n=1 Tax=Ancylobacter vacuolatus TaxID=223389 RepID=A0ABU0DMU7_9HYPH|nr:hypothetical protein [Ancylobacter vacuolatus]MDQ0349774.1 hypothetical protein [Ancylobacter vacuolatus]
MSGLSFTAIYLVTWAVWSPASFVRHLAEIADAFEAKRAKLRDGRETAP